MKFAYPYMVFQTLYIAFAKYILQTDTKFQYTTPYWILWYLLALFIWTLTISIFSDTEKIARNFVIIGVVVALLAGYDPTVSYYLSLSRTIVMFPFFACGHYLKKKGVSVFDNNADRRTIHPLAKCFSILGVILVSCTIFVKQNTIQASWAYHSQPYQVLDYNFLNRFFLLAAASVFIVFLCIFVPAKSFPVITRVGQNTLTIFLLHGFLIRYLAYKQMLSFSGITAVLITFLILWLLSRKIVKRLMDPLLEWPFT